VPNAPSDVDFPRTADASTHVELAATPAPPAVVAVAPVLERGGPAGPEPTRFGDWERNGRCIDF
jgi:hypothetical protein